MEEHTVHWNSSPHPISDIRDWSTAGRLELRPDFQRLEVWSSSARIMLMDTVLRGVPMPKIFVANTIRDGNTYRVVIDGQQRLSAILDFLRDGFPLEEPYTGDERTRKFSELDQEMQNRFLSYQIDFNEALNPSDEEVREVYARVNKYTVPLNKQELRRADFPGDFLNVSEELATKDYFDVAGIFTATQRRRYLDVEYVSELLAAMIAGIQDKKDSLDDFYTKYAQWEETDRNQITSRFSSILTELSLIFDDSLPISKTRFRQRADFYTLFLVLDEFVSNRLTIDGKERALLQADLRLLHDKVRPESEVEICSEYAIKCVSQANSSSSRRWRYYFLKAVLAGTYLGAVPSGIETKMFYRFAEGIDENYSPYSPSDICPSSVMTCPVCDQELSESFSECLLAWDHADSVRQTSNSHWIHPSCNGDRTGWRVLPRSYDSDAHTNLF